MKLSATEAELSSILEEHAQALHNEQTRYQQISSQLQESEDREKQLQEELEQQQKQQEDIGEAAGGAIDEEIHSKLQQEMEE